MEATVATNTPDERCAWQPKWTVKTPGGGEVGVTIDDHCFMVLSADEGGNGTPLNISRKRLLS